MHYKNGREANDGDPVVFNGYANGQQKVLAGILHSTNAACDACNGRVAVPVVGNCEHHYVTIGEVFHAEDAFKAVAETNSNAPVAQAA